MATGEPFDASAASVASRDRNAEGSPIALNMGAGNTAFSLRRFRPSDDRFGGTSDDFS